MVKGKSVSQGQRIADIAGVGSYRNVVVGLLVNQIVQGLLLVLAPVRYMIGWHIVCGRNAWNLVKAVERAVVRRVGWLMGSQFGGLRRWHILAGRLFVNLFYVWFFVVLKENILAMCSDCRGPGGVHDGFKDVS